MQQCWFSIGTSDGRKRLKSKGPKNGANGKEFEFFCQFPKVPLFEHEL